MKSAAKIIPAALCLLLGLACSSSGGEEAAGADQLILKSGKVISGVYLGGDAREIRFVGPGGETKTYPLTEVERLEIGEAEGASSR